MIRAGEQAGLPGTINLIAEPEAGAIVCLVEDRERATGQFASQSLRAETPGPRVKTSKLYHLFIADKISRYRIQ